MSRIVTRTWLSLDSLSSPCRWHRARHPLRIQRIAHSEKVIAVASASWECRTPDGPPWG